jgi:hypothetical protein
VEERNAYIILVGKTVLFKRQVRKDITPKNEVMPVPTLSCG